MKLDCLQPLVFHAVDAKFSIFNPGSVSQAGRRRFQLVSRLIESIS